MTHINDQRSMKYAEVRRVLWIVFIANLSITTMKITLGLITGALAVVADGFHSLVDSSSNLIGLAAIRLASRPPDKRHPYGYQRYETLGALAIGGLLLVAAWEIVGEIYQRLTQGGQPDITIPALILMILSFPMNAFIAYLETRAGRRLNSEILIADAVHTRTDLYITASVIVSMFVAWRGWVWLDFLVASIVIIQIIRAAFGILGDAAGSLADVVGVSPDIVEDIAQSVPGVLFVHRIRSRGTSQAVFVDLHIKVDPAMSTSHAHAIASEVESKLIKQIPDVVDALVHIEPGLLETPSEWERIANDLRRIADGMGLGLHDLHVHLENENKYSIELHLEMERNINLGEAHEIADEFENRVKDRWPEAATLITHLEPLPDQLLQQDQVLSQKMMKDIRLYLHKLIGEDNLLEIQIRQVEEHASLGARLRLPPDLSLIEAHSRVEEIERLLLNKFPELYRVVVHVEP